MASLRLKTPNGSQQDMQMQALYRRRTWLLPTVLDWIMLASLAFFVWGSAHFCLKPNSIPFEDAAMLMRYSQHFAQGDGIVWNVGEKPVDGATDFLFMALLALATKTDLTLEASVCLIGVASHLLTAWIVYIAVRGPTKGSVLLALAAAMSFVLGPGLWYVALYFGTPFFALFSALSWLLALLFVESKDRPDPRLAPCFGLSCLFMALTRPEGVLFSLFMVVAIVFYKRWSYSKPLVLWTAGIFLVLGGVYFGWHWVYFGYPLPNPYYVKGGGHLHPDAFKASLKNTLMFIQLWGLVFVIGLLNAKTRTRTLFSLIPIALFACVWILMSNEMNHLKRFQYALFPLICMAWPFIVVHLPNRGRTKLISAIVMILALVSQLALSLTRFGSQVQTRSYRDPNYDIARLLTPYSDRHYTMATSEAGLLPLYSQWQSIDMWGLNDPWIAHHGVITREYLEQQKPEIIIFHAPYDAAHPLQFPIQENPTPLWPLGRRWSEMIHVAAAYAIQQHYELAACNMVGGNGAYYYFVKRDFKDSRVIARLIRTKFEANSP